MVVSAGSFTFVMLVGVSDVALLVGFVYRCSVCWLWVTLVGFCG